MIADHVFEPITDFHDRLEASNVVVAGAFAQIFYRNGIAIGLPIVTCPGATDIVSQDDTVVDLEIRTIPNQTTGDSHETEPMPEEIQSIYEAG